jgi:serine protease AprX
LDSCPHHNLKKEGDCLMKMSENILRTSTIKKLFSLVLSFVLLAGVGFNGHTAKAASVEIDPILQLSSPQSIQTAILTFQGSPTNEKIQKIKGLGLKTVTFQRLPMVAVQGPKTAIEKTLSLDGLISVYSDKKLNYLLKDSVPFIGADRVWKDFGVTGKGVTAAVIDSGIDATHSDLKFGEKTIQNTKFLTGNDIFNGNPVYLENQVDTDTSSGHGTHVSGIIAGTGTSSQGAYKGVAPDAKLVGLGTGEGISILWALEAFDYVMANQQKYNIRIISNSWGTTGKYSPNDPINVASKSAHDAGMVVVFAAGNDGPTQDTLNPYSVAPWVIGVAAGTKDGKLADFSSRGIDGDSVYHPTITAPGVDIVSSRAKTGAVINGLSANKDSSYIPTPFLPYYTTASGTSMATPHISGVTALVLEANPGLQPDAVKDILVKTANTMNGYKQFEVGAGYVDAYKAVTMAKK